MSKILSRVIIRNIINVFCLAAIITAVLSLGIASDSGSFIARITGTPTAKAATSPSVTTVAANAITTTTATLNSNLTLLGTSTTVIVFFEYGTTTSYGNTIVGVPSTLTSAGAFTANLTGLTPGKTYHFRANAVGDGTGNGNDATFTTSVIPPAVTTSSAYGITTNSATLNGILSDLGTASSVTISFEYGTTTSYGNTIVGVPPTLTSAGAFTADLTDLIPDQTYHFRTKADGDGTLYGSDDTFTTAPMPTSESNWPLIAGIAGGTIVVGLIVLYIFRRNVF